MGFLKAIWKLLTTIVSTTIRFFITLYRLTITLVVIAIIGGAAYMLHPLYKFPEPTRPPVSSDDFIEWVFHGDGDRYVTQTLKIYGDGRNTITITRRQGDYDIPADLREWTFKRNTTTNTINFHQPNVIGPDQGKELVYEAIDAGIADLFPELAPMHLRVEVRRSFGGRVETIIGPVHGRAGFHWNPKVWINRTRWEKVVAVIKSDPELHELTKKTSYYKPTRNAHTTAPTTAAPPVASTNSESEATMPTGVTPPAPGATPATPSTTPKAAPPAPMDDNVDDW